MYQLFLFFFVLEISDLITEKGDGMLPTAVGLGKQLYDVVTRLVDQSLEEDDKGTETLDMFRIVLREISGIPQKENNNHTKVLYNIMMVMTFMRHRKIYKIFILVCKHENT